MAELVDLTGQKFNRWTVLNYDTDKHKWHCRCECGTERYIVGAQLKNGHTKSCGCMHYEQMHDNPTAKAHGDSHSRLYLTWKGMRSRCNNPHNCSYPRYGGRGITVCEQWNDWETFKAWALANGYAEDLTIDRIDNNGNYEPSNCRWATLQEQADNKSSCKYVTYDGLTMTLGNWGRHLGVRPETFRNRARHIGVEQAIEYYKRKVAENG